MPLRRAPVATYTLLALIALDWLLEGGLTVGGGTVNIQRAMFLGAQFTPYVLAGQWWRIVTAMFIHWSWIHVLANGWSLYVVGLLLEPILGSWRLVAVYFVGGIIGGLTAMMLMPVADVTGGASGAIFGLLGATLIVSLYTHGSARRSLFSWAVIIVVLNLGYDLFNPAIAIWDHIGGFVGGALTAAAIGLPIPGGRRGIWNTLAVVGLVLVVGVLVTGV